jgi:hypothetical protein
MILQLPAEIRVLIVEALFDGDGANIKQLAEAVNTFAAVSRDCLVAVKGAKWNIASQYENKFVSAYGIDIVAEYRYSNRFTLWRLLEISGQAIETEYTTYSNAIARITSPMSGNGASTMSGNGASTMLNFVCYTPGHGIAYFDLLKAIIMLRAQCRWCWLRDEDVYSHDILNRGKPVPDYGEESGLHIVEHLTNILQEMRDHERMIGQQRANEEPEDGAHGAEDDEESAQEREDNRMFNMMSELFRTLIFQYTNHIHTTTYDPTFMEIMRELFMSLKRPRVELPIVDLENEDLPTVKTLDSINHQICTFLNAINLSFKFEYKLYIKSQGSDSLPGVYFYQFEKLQDGHYLSRITKLE